MTEFSSSSDLFCVQSSTSLSFLLDRSAGMRAEEKTICCHPSNPKLHCLIKPCDMFIAGECCART